MEQPSVPRSPVLRTAALTLGALFCLRLLFLPLLPFMIALAFSALAEPLVQRVRRKVGVTRAFAACTVTTALLALLGGSLGCLIFQLAAELLAWSGQLPEATARLPALWNRALDHMGGWYNAAPPLLRGALDALAQRLTDAAPALIGSAGERLMGLISAVAAKLPDIGLFLVTTILAIYFTSLSYPAILAFLKRQLPPAWQQRCRRLAQCCRSTLLKWLRAELLLVLATFSLLLAGFLWMRLDYALLLATVIALVDALPVLGTGIVLLPWAGASLLLGRPQRAAALAALYSVVLLTHSLLEPRLLAGQAGLPPITALLAMYLGFHLMGVGGMVLFPLLLLLSKQLSDAGIVKLWK